MQNILQRNRGRIVEIALRLAWNHGFSRDEMHQLKWSDISFERNVITLPDREVPMDNETALCLELRRKNPKGTLSEYVMTSDRDYTHIARESLSRLIRNALNEGGLTDITAIDLRQDCVIRMLETYDWPYVARVTGTALNTLYLYYGKYFTKEAGKEKEVPCDTNGAEYESKIWKIIEAEGTSVAGLTLRMAFELEMQMQEIAALTWEQVDLENGCIALPDRTLRVSEELLMQLKTVKAERALGMDPHVILSPRAKTPFTLPWLSRVLRDALIHGGVDATLNAVRAKERARDTDAEILEFIMQKGTVTGAEIMKEFSLTKMQAYNRVQRLIERGKVVRIGTRIYLAGTVVPPEEHYEVIRAHLKKVGVAYCGELAELLGIGNRQCGWILRGIVREGKLKLDHQIYSLPSGD